MLKTTILGGGGGGTPRCADHNVSEGLYCRCKMSQNKLLFNTELLGHNAQFYKRFTFLVIVAEYRYVFLSLGMIFNILSTCSSGKVKVHINKEVIFLYSQKEKT